MPGGYLSPSMPQQSHAFLDAKRTLASFLRLVFIIFLAVFVLVQIFMHFGFLFLHPETNAPVPLLPHSIEDVRLLATTLLYHAHPDQSPFYVLLFYVLIYLWKQSFAIPGSALLNLLGGALYGGWNGAILACILTSTGSAICYLLSWFGGAFIIASLPSHRISQLRSGIERHHHNLFFYMLFLRLFPFTPNWLVNFLSPWLRIPLSYFFFSLLLGSFPYNFVCTQAGSLVHSVQSMSEVMTWSTLFKLALIASIALFPALIQDRMRRKLDQAPI